MRRKKCRRQRRMTREHQHAKKVLFSSESGGMVAAETPNTKAHIENTCMQIVWISPRLKMRNKSNETKKGSLYQGKILERNKV